MLLRSIYLIVICTAIFSCNNQPDYKHCEISGEDIRHGVAVEYGYSAYHDLAKAQNCANAEGRPILLIFTGWGCMYSSSAPWRVMDNSTARSIINKKYVLTTLYVDDRRPLDKIDTVHTSDKQYVLKTIGHKNAMIQASMFNSNTQPYYVVLDEDLNTLTEPIAYTPRGKEHLFIEFLEAGLKHFNENQNR